MGITLVVNSGSSSKKYALYKERVPVLEFRFEQNNTGFEMCTHRGSGTQECSAIAEEEYHSAISRVIPVVKKYLTDEGRTLNAVSIRIVAPGTKFQKHQIIDEAFIIALRQKELSAPLHIPIMRQEIQILRQEFPTIKLIAASDSAFHSSLPQKAREFSIDRSDAETYDIYRFGCHGLSVSSVYKRIHPLTGVNPEKLIVCHIGGGVSVTAVQNGKSVETSMGFSSASGLPMGSRSGDIDAGGLLHLMRAKNLRPAEAEMYIHTKGGLMGLSEDIDIRRLLDRKSKGDAIATQTLELFVYHIQKAITASMVSLGGVDMIAFTGTASSRSAVLRELVLKDISFLNIAIDTDRNDTLVGLDGVFSQKQSAVKLVVVRTDEMGEMVSVAEQLNLPFREN